MIEIIREEAGGTTTERHGLPKDIKQMGKPDVGDRIYVENEVYQLLHPYSNVEEKRAYVLLGSFENYGEQACVFVEAAIFLEEMMFEGELPLWNDGTWAYIYKKLRNEYENMVIVGWAMDIKGQLPNMTMRMETLHQNHFGGAHQVLFLIDSLEGEEAFYGNKNGRLYRREGFYVYYEKRGMAAGMQKEYEESRDIQATISFEEEHKKAEERPVERGKYRRQLQEEGRGFPAYMSTALLAVLVCALGLSAYWNNEKMKTMEVTLAQMNQEKSGMAEVQNTEVKVEQVAGNVTKQEEGQETVETAASPAAEQPAEAARTDADISEMTQETTDTAQVQQMSAAAVISDAPEQPAEAAQSDAPSAQSADNMQEEVTQTAAETLTQAQTYLKQGYYIVQKGDSLAGICRSIYQTTAMLDKLCEVNEIEDENEIYAGQKLILPN